MSDELWEWPQVPTEITPRMQATRDLAAAARRAIAELMSTNAPEDAIVEATGHIARAAQLLAGQPHGRSYEGAAESAVAGDVRTFFDFSPLAGAANPLAPPMVMEIDDEQVVARVAFSDAYEGPPGCVHGGFVAAAFDEVLGFTQAISGRPGMTGRLTISYRKPTPLHRELVFRGRVDRVEGRKLFAVGELHSDGVLTAEAEGLFITVDPKIFDRMLQERLKPT